MSHTIRFAVAMLGAAAACQAHAQSKGPAAQYWVDLSTTSMSIPGMQDEGMGGGMGGLLGGMMGGGMPGMGGNQGKTMEEALWVRARPSGVEAQHAIPAGMNMGSTLPLLPLRPRTAAADSGPVSRSESYEKPKGRFLLYWGCGDTVRTGQPRIIDFSKPDYKEFAAAFASHAAASRGVLATPGNAIWPNERDSKRVPDNASLAGENAVSGDGVPASLKFNVAAANDFLPRLQMNARGTTKDAMPVEWKALENAKGYFLMAQGAVDNGKDGTDTILWTSSDKPDSGWQMMTYQSPAQVAKLVQQKIVLAPSATSCTVPKGIFEKTEGSMVNMIAYGPELNASWPARPPKAPADWQPEWTARVRVKSTGMTMLGMGDEGSKGAGNGRRGGNMQVEDDAPSRQRTPEVPNPVNILKGLFGG